MDEKQIQSALWKHLNNRPYNFINTYFFENESDFLSFTASGYCYEYEVKISRSDFKADFKKPRFKILSQCIKGHGLAVIKGRVQEWMCHFDYKYLSKQIYNKREVKGITHISYKKIIETCANKFYYVVPKDLIKDNECPEFAGLIYVEKIENSFGIFYKLDEVKKAPLLHKNIHCKNNLFNKMYYEYSFVVSKLLKQ